ncbi:MAG: arylsulfatase [Balneolaceae bacterium]|nr:arylsulfatase [Balneolaceae bacterium]
MKSHLLYIAFLLLGIVTFGCLSQEQAPPNVIIILVDDLGYSDIGTYGGEISTPNLDRLAKQGLKFTQFYNTAKCTETRAQLLTGLYHQQTDNVTRSDNNVTLAEVFNQAGYETILSGKWHLGNWLEETGTPTDRGFDHFFGFLGGTINYYTGEDWGTGRNLMRRDTAVYQVPDNFYSTDAFTNYAMEQISSANGNNHPFFLYLAHNAPHFPLHVMSGEIDKYRATYSIGWDSLRQQRYEQMKSTGLIRENWALTERDSLVPAWKSLDEERRQEEQLLMAAYAGMVDRLDQQVGRLMDNLEELGVAENTIIMFLSDNGACPYDFNRTPNLPPGPEQAARSYDTEWANASNTPFRKYKQWIHEGGIATPMIVRWPGTIAPGSVTRQPGHVLDVMPTLLEAAGLSYPESFRGNKILPMEGQSLMSVWTGNSEFFRDTMFWEFRGSRAVRNGAWKLVAERGGPWELYNLDEDRTETTDLRVKHPGRVSRMARMYDRWADRVGAVPNRRAREMRKNSQDRYLYEFEK